MMVSGIPNFRLEKEVVNAETVPLTDSLSTVKPLDLVGDKHYKVVRIYNFIKHYRGVRY